MWRRSLLFVLLIGALVPSTLVALPTAASAQDGTAQDGTAQDGTAQDGTADPTADAPRFEGTLVEEGTPIEGARIEIREVDGDFTTTAVTAADGTWAAELPPRGATYEVELLVESLPEGVALSDGAEAVITPRISRPGQVRNVGFSLGDRGIDADTTAEQFAQSVVNGLKFGLIIAMASVGLSLIFGTTGLINFAHGELITFGAALAWWLNTDFLEIQLILATAVAVIGGAVIGGMTELGMMRPLRRRRLGSFQFVVVTIGMSLVGRQLFQIWIGEGNLSYRDYQIQKPWSLGPIDLTPRDLSIMAVCVVALVGVATVLQLTRLGKAMRAVSDNADLAASSGIAVDRVILAVWSSGAALAALGGVMLGLSEVVEFDMGFRFLLLMFSAVVLGGLGTAYGAMAGGVLIGLVTEVSTVWVQPELKFVWALLALILVLLVRPQGILGVKERVG